MWNSVIMKPDPGDIIRKRNIFIPLIKILILVILCHKKAWDKHKKCQTYFLKIHNFPYMLIIGTKKNFFEKFIASLYFNNV